MSHHSHSGSYNTASSTVASIVSAVASATDSSSASSTGSSSYSGHGSSSSSNSTTSDTSSSNSTSSSSSSYGHSSSGKSGKSGHGGGSSEFTKPYQLWMWEVTCALIGLLAIYYAVQLVRRWHRKRSPVKDRELAAKKRWKPWAGIVAATRNKMVATSFPSWLYAPETVADALWTCVYILVTLVFTLYDASTWKNTQAIANQFGIIVFAQLPFIMFVVMKNNPISYITGISYQNLNYLHRAGTRCIMLWAWVHTGLSTFKVKGKAKAKGGKGFGEAYIVWGFVGVLSYTLLWATSFAIIRRRLHQFFFTAHIVLAILCMVGAYLHWDKMGTWVWMCFVIWGYDRVVRWGRTIWANRLWTSGRGECTIEVMEGDAIRLTFKRYGFKWSAGQHVFISAPRVSYGPVEAHPFTIANAVNDDHEVVVVARVYGGFTNQLLKAVSSSSEKKVRCYIDGPYGQAHSFGSYDHVLMVSGGTGISPWTAQLLELVNSKKRARCQLIRIVWIVREASAITWVAPILNKAAELLKANSSGVQVSFDVYVTRGPVPAFSSVSASDSSSYSSMSGDPEKREHRIHADESTYPASSPDPEKSGQSTPTEGSSEDLHNAVVHLPIAPKEVPPLADHPAHQHIRKVLSPDALRFVHFYKGRPDLKSVIERDASTCPEAMAYSVCGPWGVMQTCRTALKEASNFRSVLGGQTPIDFFEETLGQ
ncbi:hypothetical protein IAR50_003588 [Cryptococcus sp. DSM 104548]